jgi:DNA-binding transcriptional LysR family regulator
MIFPESRKMIEDFRSLAVFVAVADAGSLSAAGRRLKISTSVVSHHLSRIEEKMGVTLFFRSTRSISLTPEGHAALPAARRMVEAGEEALDALSDGSDEPVGALRITMPAWGEKSHLRQSLWAFAKQHPLIAISLHSSDAPVDLVKEGFDVAIRLGTLSDSSLKSRRIGDFQRLLVAAPSYLASRTPIRTIEDLAACDFIAFTMIPDAITLHSNGKSVTFHPENVRLEMDTIGSTKSAVVAGLGIQQLPRDEIVEELASGQLVQVLPKWRLPDLGIYAVWPDRGPQKTLTRRLIDHFVKGGF